MIRVTVIKNSNVYILKSYVLNNFTHFLRCHVDLELAARLILKSQRQPLLFKYFLVITFVYNKKLSTVKVILTSKITALQYCFFHTAAHCTHTHILFSHLTQSYTGARTHTQIVADVNDFQWRECDIGSFYSLLL